MFEQGRQFIFISTAFSVSLWSWIGSMLPGTDEALYTMSNYGVSGLLLLAVIITGGALGSIYLSLIALYRSIISDKDKRIERLESELREARAKR